MTSQHYSQFLKKISPVNGLISQVFPTVLELSLFNIVNGIPFIFTLAFSLILRYEQVVQPCWESSATSRPTASAILTKIEALFLRGAPGAGYYYENTAVAQKPGRNNKAFEPDA